MSDDMCGLACFMRQHAKRLSGFREQRITVFFVFARIPIDQTCLVLTKRRPVPYSAPPHRAADTHLQATAFHRQFARAIGAPALNSVRRCFVFGFEHRRDSNSSSLFFCSVDSVLMYPHPFVFSQWFLISGLKTRTI